MMQVHKPKPSTTDEYYHKNTNDQAQQRLGSKKSQHTAGNVNTQIRNQRIVDDTNHRKERQCMEKKEENFADEVAKQING